MKCSQCNCCKLGWFPSSPNKYVCTGVREPFVIDNINVECTEYSEKAKLTIDDLVNIFDMTIEDMEEYRKNAIDILRKNGQYATAKATEKAFGLMIAVEKLNNIGCTSFRMTADELRKLGVE